MSDITIAQQQTALTTGDMLAGVLEAARDGSVDVSKLGALIGLAERWQDRAAKQAFDTDMVACQAEMPRIRKDGTIQIRKGGEVVGTTRYARLERIDEEVRPIYERYGFSISVSYVGMENNKYVFAAVVRHKSGHSETHKMPLALDQSGAKNDTQAMGSTFQYGRRYLLCGIFNIITVGEDNDANGPQYISEDQALEIRDLIRETGGNEARFAAIYGAATIEEIPARMYRAALGVLRQKQAVRR